MNFKLTLLTPAALFLSFGLAAQIDFRPGYIVNEGSDTVKGWVAYQADKRNQVRCVFKKTRRAQPQTYSATEIRGYAILNDRAYESIKLPVDSPVQGTVFARVLAAGPINLYRFSNFFVTYQANEWTTLPVPQTMEIKGNGKVMVSRDTRFLGILNKMTRDCLGETTDLHYAEGDLTDLVVSYNTCKNPGVTPRKMKNSIRVNFRLVSGFSTSQLKYDFVQKFTFNNQTVTGGAGFEFSLPGINDKVFFSIDANYVASLFQAYHEMIRAGDMVRRDVILDVSCLKVPFGFRYNFLGGSRPSPYLTFGGTWSGILKTSNRTIEERQLPDAIYREVYENQYQTKNIKGYWLGVGVSMALTRGAGLFVEFRREGGEGYLGSPVENDSKLINYNLICGLRF